MPSKFTTVGSHTVADDALQGGIFDVDAKKAQLAAFETIHGPPPQISAVVAVVHALKAAGVPVACATSGIREVVEEHLAKAGLLGLFDARLQASTAYYPSPVVYGAFPPDLVMAVKLERDPGCQRAWAAR